MSVFSDSAHAASTGPSSTTQRCFGRGASGAPAWPGDADEPSPRTAPERAKNDGGFCAIEPMRCSVPERWRLTEPMRCSVRGAAVLPVTVDATIGATAAAAAAA